MTGSEQCGQEPPIPKRRQGRWQSGHHCWPEVRQVDPHTEINDTTSEHINRAALGDLRRQSLGELALCDIGAAVQPEQALPLL